LNRHLAGGKGSDVTGTGTFSLGANHFVVIGIGREVDEVEDLAVSGLRWRSRLAAGDVELCVLVAFMRRKTETMTPSPRLRQVEAVMGVGTGSWAAAHWRSGQHLFLFFFLFHLFYFAVL
jgi:hypothetical protein